MPTELRRILVTGGPRHLREARIGDWMGHSWGPLWVQHSPDDLTSIAEGSFDSRSTSEAQIEPRTAEHLSASEYARLRDLIPATGIRVVNADVLVSDRKQIVDVLTARMNSKQLPTDTDVAALIVRSISTLGFEGKFTPALAFAAFYRAFDSHLDKGAIFLVPTKGDADQLLRYLAARGVPGELAQAVNRDTYISPVIWKKATGGSQYDYCTVVTPAHCIEQESVQAIKVTEAKFVALLDFVSRQFGIAAPSLVFSTAFERPLKVCEVDESIADIDFTFNQRTFEPGAKANFVEKQWSDIFTPGAKVFVRTFPGAATPVCTAQDGPQLLAGIPDLHANGITKIVIATPDNCDVLHNWAQGMVDVAYRTPGNWLYQNPAALDPMFVEKNFVLVSDQNLDVLKHIVPTSFHARLKRQVPARGAFITDGPTIVLKRVEDNAANCAIVTPASMIQGLKNKEEESSSKRMAMSGAFL